MHINVTAKHGYPVIKEKEDQPKGIWEQWKNGIMDDKKFVDIIRQLAVQQGFAGISKDPTIRKGILNALNNFAKTKDYKAAAKSIGAFLSMGEHVSEEHFASANWYKRATMDYPELRGDIPASEKEWLHPSLKERVIESFKEKYPNTSATIEEMWNWYRKNFTGLPGKKYNWEAHQKRDLERAKRDLIERIKNKPNL